MKQKSGPGKAPAEQVLKDIRRQTRRQARCIRRNILTLALCLRKTMMIPPRQKSAAPDLGCSWQALSTVDVDRQFDFANGECCQW